MSWIQLILASALLFVSISSFSDGPVLQTFDRVVVFGDSLSDVGTYSHVAGPKGGGKFTTNPSKIWVEYVAEKLNLEIKPNRHEGFGQPTQYLSGHNYAQGGSRIVFETEKNPDKPGASAIPIATQVGYFLIENETFKKSDLVLAQGGANDIFWQLNLVSSGRIKPQEAIENVVNAAKDFGVILGNMKSSGQPKIVVINLPQIQKTPRFLSSSEEVQNLVKLMVLQFNEQLKKETQELQLQLIDFYSFDESFNNIHTQYGIENINQPACRIDLLPNNSSLFCNSKTLVSANADQTYKFADSVHPTAAFSRIVGQFVSEQIKFNPFHKKSVEITVSQ